LYCISYALFGRAVKNDGVNNNPIHKLLQNPSAATPREKLPVLQVTNCISSRSISAGEKELTIGIP
jgi:hypothetical protein